MNAPEAASARADAWLSPSTQRLVDDAVTALEPVRQALLASDHRVYNSPSSRGVLMVSVHGGVNSTANIAPHDEPECVAALRSLRRQAARHHVTLAADNITLLQLEQLGALRLWDSHIMLHPQEAERVLLSDARWRANAQELQLVYAWKLIALAASPYQETVFIDNDILVLSHTLVSDLLDHSLHVSDLAFVQDPARPRSEARERVNLASARLQGRIVTSPLMYARGVPPLCTCVMAYRRTPSVRQLLHRATARLFLRLNTLDVSTPSTPTHIRQSDQEMIWFQLVTGTPDPLLRLLVLPEEYYCPTFYPKKSKTATAYHHLVKTIAGGEAPHWLTRWGKYACHSVHLHHSHQHLGNALPRFKDETIETFEAKIGRPAG
jgi:hypothetical protein